MDLFLRILGVLAVIVALGIALAAGFVWWFLRRLKKGLGATPPLTIDLVEDTAPDWLTKAPFIETIRDFDALGFSRVGPFEVSGIPGVRLLGFCHQPSGVFACCYNHPQAGCFIDLCANLTDGFELTVTNAPAGGEMDTRPGTEKVFLAGRPLPELYATLLEKIAGRTAKPCAPERFKEDFVAAYARDMAWRSAKLGVSEAEFRRVASKDGKTRSDEHLAAAFRQTKLQEIRLWAGDAAEEFAKTTNLSVARWKEFEDDLIVFRDDFHPAAYLEYLTDSVEVPNKAREELDAELSAGLPLARLLDRISATTGHSFVHLGAVERPLRCEIYGLKRPPGDR
jgi:hypothetical protein